LRHISRWPAAVAAAAGAQRSSRTTCASGGSARVAGRRRDTGSESRFWGHRLGARGLCLPVSLLVGVGWLVRIGGGVIDKGLDAAGRRRRHSRSAAARRIILEDAALARICC
jgi:hypothetical protein